MKLIRDIFNELSAETGGVSVDSRMGGARRSAHVRACARGTGIVRNYTAPGRFHYFVSPSRLDPPSLNAIKRVTSDMHKRAASSA